MSTLKVVFKNSALHFVCLDFVLFSVFTFFPRMWVCVFFRIVLYSDSRCPDALDRQGVSIGQH